MVAYNQHQHIHSLDSTISPSTAADCEAMEAANPSHYSAVDQLIQVLITCCPVISFPDERLSKFSTHPATTHKDAGLSSNSL
jgi:hypothetical protein